MKIKTLFYGFRHGHIYDAHKKITASDKFQIVGYLEENPKARAEAEKNLGVIFSDLDYGTWLKSDIDTVVIGNAYGDRGEAVIQALEAGKNIIIDKPICTNLEQLDKIAKLCANGKVHLQCMLDLRYLPQSIKARKIISGGELGTVRNVSFQGQHMLNYGIRPDWYFEPGMHGGTINDLAIHGIDIVRMVTGEEFSGIDAARTWNSYAVHTPNFKDCAIFMARLKNNAGVMADISYSAPNQSGIMPTYWEFRFWCDEGLLTYNFGTSAVTVFKKSEENPIVIPCEDTDYNYVDEFLEELSSGNNFVTKNVLQSSKIALTIQKWADERSEYAKI